LLFSAGVKICAHLRGGVERPHAENICGDEVKEGYAISLQLAESYEARNMTTFIGRSPAEDIGYLMFK